MMPITRTLCLPEELCVAAEKKFGHRFDNLEQCLAALLRELLREDAVSLDVKEQEIVEQRLRGLGYV
jgi:hypothetical protein